MTEAEAVHGFIAPLEPRHDLLHRCPECGKRTVWKVPLLLVMPWGVRPWGVESACENCGWRAHLFREDKS